MPSLAFHASPRRLLWAVAVAASVITVVALGILASTQYEARGIALQVDAHR